MSEQELRLADSGTSATPSSDWRDREEGTEYTPEQLARKFLDSDWDQQVAIMNKAMENAGVATACRMLNHEGAHIFATRHTCHDRYQEGFEAGKQALADHMQALADEMFGHVPEGGPVTIADVACRPAARRTAGREPLPHELVQYDGYDGPQQDEHRADNTDLVVQAVAFRAVAFLWRHGFVPLSVRAHAPGVRLQKHAAQLHRAVRMHSMKTSHDPCDQRGRHVAHLYLGRWRAPAVFCISSLLWLPTPVPRPVLTGETSLSPFRVLNPTHSYTSLPITALSCC